MNNVLTSINSYDLMFLRTILACFPFINIWFLNLQGTGSLFLYIHKSLEFKGLRNLFSLFTFLVFWFSKPKHTYFWPKIFIDSTTFFQIKIVLEFNTLNQFFHALYHKIWYPKLLASGSHFIYTNLWNVKFLGIDPLSIYKNFENLVSQEPHFTFHP